MAIYYDLLVYHDLSDPTDQLLRIGIVDLPSEVALREDAAVDEWV